MGFRRKLIILPVIADKYVDGGGLLDFGPLPVARLLHSLFGRVHMADHMNNPFS